MPKLHFKLYWHVHSLQIQSPNSLETVSNILGGAKFEKEVEIDAFDTIDHFLTKWCLVRNFSTYCFDFILIFTMVIQYPMDSSSSIRHRFDVEIPRGKFVEITSILKGESTWKLWHRFDVDISTWIRLSKSTKYRWVLHVDFSMSFRRQIDVTSVLAVSIF